MASTLLPAPPLVPASPVSQLPLCSLKAGRVVIILQGRFAGRKAVIVQAYDDGHGDRKFGHAVVAGIDKAPKRVTRSMSQKKFNKRTAVKPFVKFVNYNHLMPTRYNLDVADKIKALLGDDTLTNEEKRKSALKTLKTTLDERYKALQTGKDEKAALGVKYFFQKLHF